MNAPSLPRPRSTALLTLAALVLSAAPGSAQTTKAPPAPKVQEKAKAKATEKAKAADLVDLNTATAEELMTLPGIGEATARKIIEGRPYEAVDDLEDAGVTAAATARIKPLATARPLPAPVDVNAASVAKLQELPGVGPALADSIVAGRPYKDFADLAKVRGLGATKIDELRGRVSFGKAAVAVEKAKDATKSAGAAAKAAGGAAKEKMEDVAAKGKAKLDTAKDAAKSKLDMAKEKVATKAGSVAEKAKAKADEVASKAKADMKKAEVAKAKRAPGQKININTATAAELDELFGVGEVKSQAIIDGRPYAKIEDIMKVRGIKKGTFEKLKDQITVK